jgi:cytochrome c-type biogenesis protein CcmH/NrfG
MRYLIIQTSLIILLLGSSAFSGLAQVHSTTEPIEIRGQVRFAVGGRPAERVNVRLESVSGGFVGEERTDSLGKFRFAGLQPIQYLVSIRLPGFREIQREVNLVMIPSDYIQLGLVPEGPVSGGASTYSPKLLDANVPAEARKEFEKGDAALLGNKTDEGIRHLEKAIQIYPKFVEAELRLGAAYMDQRNWDKAEQALRHAFETDSRAANAQFALGEIYFQQRRFNEAEKALLKGLEIENRSWQGHFALGRLYWTRGGNGDNQRAGRQVAITLQLNSEHAPAHLLAGNILLRANKRDDAIMEFQEYLRLAPKGEFASQVRETLQKIRPSKSD